MNTCISRYGYAPGDDKFVIPPVHACVCACKQKDNVYVYVCVYGCTFVHVAGDYKFVIPSPMGIPDHGP